MERAFSGQTSAISQKEALNNQHSAFSQNQDQQQQQRQNFLSPEQQAEALVRRIGEACDELERLAEENPELVGRVTHGAEEHKEAYLRLKARLALAEAAPRCRWVRQDGTTCGSPQMKRHIYCFAHKQLAEAQALALMLPALEDANAIQVGLMRIQKALIDDTISTKKAGLLLYSMQLAMTNVGQTTFGKAADDDLVTDTVEEKGAIQEETAVDIPGPIFTRDIPGLREYHTYFTAENAEGAEENKTLPLMNADDTDQRRELPRMDADERGLGRDNFGRMVMKPIPTRDLELLGQSHAKMG